MNNSQPLIKLKEHFNSNNIIEKILQISGYHICYWEFDIKKSQYSEASGYQQLEGVKFYELNWPKNLITDDSWESYSMALTNLHTKNWNIDCVVKLKKTNSWIKIITKFDPLTCIYSGIVKDITEDVQIDETIRKRTIELSAFDEGLDNFTIVARTDSHGRITYANNEFCRLSKYTIDELIGKDHRILNSSHHPKEFFTSMWASIKTGQSWRGLIKNKAKDGSFYWVDTIIIPIRDENGELLEVLSFRYDVTLLNKYKEENERLKEYIAKYVAKDEIQKVI